MSAHGSGDPRTAGRVDGVAAVDAPGPTADLPGRTDDAGRTADDAGRRAATAAEAPPSTPPVWRAAFAAILSLTLVLTLVGAFL